MCGVSRDTSRRALDRGLNAVVGHAAAEDPRHPFSNLLIGRMGRAIEERLRRHDLPVLAEAALRHLLFDPGLLNGMELPADRQSLQRRHLAADRRYRCHARACCHTVDDHGAGTALTEPAAEFRPMEVEIV